MTPNELLQMIADRDFTTPVAGCGWILRVLKAAGKVRNGEDGEPLLVVTSKGRRCVR